MKRLGLWLSVCVLATFVTSCGSGNAEPRTLLVPENFSTIQAAVNAAKPGDLVLISPGIYKESVKVDQEQIVRGLSIVANIGIIADSLDQNSPALTDVFTPDEPAKDKVLKVSPVKHTGKYWNKIKKSVRKYF